MEEAIVDPGPDELPAADPVEQPQQPTQNMDAVFSGTFKLKKNLN